MTDDGICVFLCIILWDRIVFTNYVLELKTADISVSHLYARRRLVENETMVWENGPCDARGRHSNERIITGTLEK